MSAVVARRWLLFAALLAIAFVSLQCQSPRARAVDSADWDVVYRVLQHPRCVNCHPAGDRPLVGDAGAPHPQNVQRGADGTGRLAMRCTACHQDRNTYGAHLPPGAPHWQLPHPDMPLVFEGRSKQQLADQLLDRAQNGGRSPEQLLHHVEQDPLVLWGWAPGTGRAPVDVPHAEFVAAFRGWLAANAAPVGSD